MNETDKKIEQLEKTLKAKELELKKVDEYNYKTNLSFKLPFVTDDSFKNAINLNIASKELLTSLFGQLCLWKKGMEEAADLLGVDVDLVYLGYHFNDWMNDFGTKIAKLETDKRKTELKNLKSTLESLRSEESKKQKMLESIEKALI